MTITTSNDGDNRSNYKKDNYDHSTNTNLNTNRYRKYLISQRYNTPMKINNQRSIDINNKSTLTATRRSFNNITTFVDASYNNNDSNQTTAKEHFATNN